MPVSSLPPAPSRADPPATFVAKADAFVAALQQLVTEMNAVVGVANITKWISGTTYAIGDVTWSPLDFQAYRRKTAGAGTTDPSLDTTNWQRSEVSGTSLQGQDFTAFTSAGTAPAFTLTPSPAIAAYAANQRFRVKFHSAGTTGSNTLNVSGKGAKSIKQYDATGTKVAGVVVASQLADLEYDGTDWVILDPLPVVATTTQKGSVQLATNSVAQGGTNATDALTPAALKAAQIQPGTVVNTTSGTAIDFTGIPSWVNRITVMFSVLSTNGSNALQLQIGSGSVQTTGYTGAASGILGATGGSTSLTSGFALTPGGSIDAAGSQRSGMAVLTRITGTTWVVSGSLCVSGLGSAGTTYFGGVVAVSGVVDRLRLTTVGATDAFDGGQVNILWE